MDFRGTVHHLPALNQELRGFEIGVQGSRIEPHVLIDPGLHVVTPINEKLDGVGNLIFPTARWLEVWKYGPKFGAEEVESGHREVALGFGGLLHQLCDSIPIDRSDPKAPWIGDGLHDVEIGASGVAELRGVSLETRSVDRIAEVQDKGVTIDKILSELYGVGEAERFGLAGVTQVHPESRAISQRGLHLILVFADHDANVMNAQFAQALKGVVQSHPVRNGQQGFRNMMRNWEQPGPFSGRENNTLHVARVYRSAGNLHGMKHRHGGWVMLLALVLSGGCRPAASGPAMRWIETPTPFVPRTDGGGFDAVCLAGAAVEEKLTPTELAKVSFSDREKREMIALLQPEINRLATGIGGAPRFEYSPTPPLTVPPFQAGWRLLGEVLAWKTKQAVEAGNFMEAASTFRLALSFGFLLTGGDAETAQMGFHIVDSSRAELAPALGRMSAAQLTSIQERLHDVLSNFHGLGPTLENESKNVLFGIQHFQDAAERQSWEGLAKDFGGLGTKFRKVVAPLAVYSSDWKDVFIKLDERRQSELRAQLERASVPAARREGYDKLKGGEFGKLWIRTFGMAGRGLIQSADITLTRCRLMGLYCSLRRTRLSGSTLPANLATLPDEWRLDPMTGSEFVYRTNGTEFDCYSRGQNDKDDLGRTDESGTMPDLRLEK